MNKERRRIIKYWLKRKRRFLVKALLDENRIYLLDEDGNILLEE